MTDHGPTDTAHGVPSGRALLLGLLTALAGWACGFAIHVQQWLSGGPTYTYWLETTVSPLLVSPVALLLAARRPGHRLAWLFAGFVAVGSLQLLAGAAATALAASVPSTAAVLALLHDALQMGIVVLLATVVMLYPTGRLPSARWSPVAWCVLGGGGVTAATGLLAPRLDNFPTLQNPIGTAAAAVRVVEAAGAAVFLVGILAAIAVPVARYRRSRGLERLQLRWFTFSVVVGVVLLVGVGSQLAGGPAASVLWTLVPSGVLASIGVAVFRYRLLEIDRIISRTVSYAVLSALLVGLYVLAVVVLTPALAGFGRDSTAAVPVATLLVAAAFRPLRRRVQSIIDRRFDRAGYDAARAVEAFAGELRNEVDIEHVRARLVGVVSTTVAPRSVSLWLAKEPAGAGEEDRAA